MSEPAKLQLLLLDTSVFEAGPSRARSPKQPRVDAAPKATLELSFEAPRKSADDVPAVSTLEDARRRAVERSQARLRAKLEPAAALQRKSPVSVPSSDELVDHGEEEPRDEAEQAVFLVRRKLSAVARSAMLRAFADRLGGALKRTDQFEAKVNGDVVTGSLSAGSLVLRFSSRAARQRWLHTIQRLAREHDLVEPE